MLWGSYSLMFVGYVLMKDYDLTIKQLFYPTKAGVSWPPQTLSATSTYPWSAGASAASGASTSGTGAGVPNVIGPQGTPGALDNPSGEGNPNSAVNRAR